MDKTEKKKIFLSHAYPDRKIADRIIDKILLPIFELDKQKDIFYTSKRETGIRSSVNWRNRIKKNLIDCEIFISLITTNYKKSEMCLGELGAAWVQDKKVYALILPPIKYENFSVIFSEQQADILINKEDIKAFIVSLNIELMKVYKIGLRENFIIDDNIIKFVNSVKRYLKTNTDLFKLETEVLEKEQTSKRKTEIRRKPKEKTQHKQLKREELDLIKERSGKEWPNEYSMQEYYINEQTTALKDVQEIIAQTKQQDKIRIIEKIIKEWPEDYSMQLFKINEEFDSYNRLNKHIKTEQIFNTYPRLFELTDGLIKLTTNAFRPIKINDPKSNEDYLNEVIEKYNEYVNYFDTKEFLFESNTVKLVHDIREIVLKCIRHQKTIENFKQMQMPGKNIVNEIEALNTVYEEQVINELPSLREKLIEIIKNK